MQDRRADVRSAECHAGGGRAGFKVTGDPNRRFHTAAQTIALAEQLAPLGNVKVFEDPILKSDIEGYEQIHEAIPFP